jgi:hypothetical protein
MAHMIYKEHTIVYSSRLGGDVENPAGFLPIAAVVWTDLNWGVRRVENLKLRGVYHSDEEARAMALSEARLWVDKKFE